MTRHEKWQFKVPPIENIVSKNRLNCQFFRILRTRVVIHANYLVLCWPNSLLNYPNLRSCGNRVANCIFQGPHANICFCCAPFVSPTSTNHSTLHQFVANRIPFGKIIIRTTVRPVRWSQGDQSWYAANTQSSLPSSDLFTLPCRPWVARFNFLVCCCL